MAVRRYRSQRASGEMPLQGPSPYRNADLGWSSISGNTQFYELTRQKSAALTYSEADDGFSKLDTLISVQSAPVISETSLGFIIIG